MEPYIPVIITFVIVLGILTYTKFKQRHDLQMRKITEDSRNEYLKEVLDLIKIMNKSNSHVQANPQPLMGFNNKKGIDEVNELLETMKSS